MKTQLKQVLAAACLIVQVVPASAGSVTLDHSGDGRDIWVESWDSDTAIISRGDGGSLDAEIGWSEDVSIYHLGGESDAMVGIYDSAGTDIFIGHCPEGMTPETVEVEGDANGLIIPRCW
jgi:hypothetical protein